MPIEIALDKPLSKNEDELALLLGKQFLEQLRNYLQTQKHKEA